MTYFMDRTVTFKNGNLPAKLVTKKDVQNLAENLFM